MCLGLAYRLVCIDFEAATEMGCGVIFVTTGNVAVCSKPNSNEIVLAMDVVVASIVK